MDGEPAQQGQLPSLHLSSSFSVEEMSASSLPKPRTHSLKPGSQKEAAFIKYADSKILRINRRYVKKYSSDRNEIGEEGRGYDRFEDVILDLEQVLDAVWVSGTLITRSISADLDAAGLQIPYLLALAGIVAEYLPAFSFDPGPTHRLVKKLDYAFATLLDDEDGRPVSITNRVRIRSVVENTRLVAVDAAAKRNNFPEDQKYSETPTDTEQEDGIPLEGQVGQNSLDMSISTMYERSISILGDSLG